MFIASGGLCFAMYGVWAMAECHLEALPSEMPEIERFLWRLTGGLAGLLGVIGAFFMIFTVVSALLGTWIS